MALPAAQGALPPWADDEASGLFVDGNLAEMDEIRRKGEKIMKVMLIAHTPTPEEIVAAAAKTCYSARPVETVMENLDGESAASFVEMLASIGHESPIEHASFTFAIEGVSRSLLAQITRHRIASFSVRSQRYVSERKFDYVMPPQIADDAEAKAIFEEVMEAERTAYNKITKVLLDRKLSALPEAERENKSRVAALRRSVGEDARYVLPNACCTQLVMTMNARELKNFFRQRCCMRAQWEIRELATQMLFQVRAAAPTLFADAGPACVHGPCPEGKMSCGLAAQMREKFKAEER